MELDETTSHDADAIEWKGCRTFVPPTVARAARVDLDLSRVWLTSEHALHYWTRELDATIYEIRDAIEDTGSRCAEAVRRYLGRSPREPDIHRSNEQAPPAATD
jgi:hypothetical protein